MFVAVTRFWRNMEQIRQL